MVILGLVRLTRTNPVIFRGDYSTEAFNPDKCQGTNKTPPRPTSCRVFAS